MGRKKRRGMIQILIDMEKERSIQMVPEIGRAGAALQGSWLTVFPLSNQSARGHVTDS